MLETNTTTTAAKSPNEDSRCIKTLNIGLLSNFGFQNILINLILGGVNTYKRTLRGQPVVHRVVDAFTLISEVMKRTILRLPISHKLTIRFKRS